jgi:putative phosphoesterase
MRILVISDTHGNYPRALRAWDLAEPFDAVIHLGDGGDDADLLSRIIGFAVIRVAGNCDHGSTEPRELLLDFEGKRLLLAHGDRYGVKSGLARLEQRGIELGVDCVLFGHTHHATIVTLSGILFVNPGTLMRSSRQATVAILDITPAGITANLHDIAP